MQARSARTRNKLVHAGAELFDRKGYAQATLAQIAEAAGLTKGALYFHFSSKDGLADDIEEQAQTTLHNFIQTQKNHNTTPIQALIDLTHFLSHTLQHDPVVRASFRISHENTGRQPTTPDFHDAWITEALNLIDRAKEQDRLNKHRTRDEIRALLSTVICGIGVLAATGSPRLQLEKDITALWNQLLPRLVPETDLTHYRTHPTENLTEQAA